ncbi:MAG: hypothetical protein ACRDWA_17405 [Acidimicrobiia bacterium]
MVRVVAIVDSRNIRGLSETMLGFARNPTSQGLDTALSRFGFEVVESYFSVARPRASDRQRLERQDAANREYLDLLRRDPRVRPLEGSLRRYSDGSIEEKMVDVLCAVECVRQAKRIADGDSSAEAVLVLSQDIDIKPGVELAIEFDVPVLVVSPGAIHNRGIPFMAIAEPPLADLVQAERIHDVSGQELRQRLAIAVDSPGVDSWEYLYTKRIGGESVAILRHRQGYEGAAEAEIFDRPERGELHDLGTMGIAEGLPTGFPRALLGLAPYRAQDLLRGTVVGRYSLFKATVDLESGVQVLVDVSNSFLTPGTRVLLHASGGATRPRYVGALETPPPLVGSGGRELPATSLVVRVEGHSDRHSVATSEEAGIGIFIPSGSSKTQIGGRYLVSLVGSGRDFGAPLVGHIASTRLP